MTTDARASRASTLLVVLRVLGASAAIAFTISEYVSVWLSHTRLCDPVLSSVPESESALEQATVVTLALVVLLLWPLASLWTGSRALIEGPLAFLLALVICSLLEAHILFPAHLGVAARQGRPLIAAIQRHIEREGRAPLTLEALVPGDLERVPGTWLGTGHYEYEVVDESTEAARWSLTIWLRNDGDSAPPCLCYESDERYDIGARYESSAISVRRIGRWAYCRFG
jgi:hypothetical protein